MSPEHADGENTPESRTSSDEFDQSGSITGLFDDAALYKQVITESTAGSRLSSEPPARNPALRSVQDFAELVGNDLEKPEQDVVSRFAQLAVDNWTIDESDHPDANIFTEEPESLSDEEEAARTLSQPEGGAPLSPERVIVLLNEEYGPLAPEGEERVLLDADGAVIQDVIILVSKLSWLAFRAKIISYLGGHSSYYPSHCVSRNNTCI
jgi:sterol 3beta-glucosyltransferase